MSESTKIAWCDASWNPVVGCARVSAGCEHCYAERFAHRWRNIEGHALGGLTREGGGWNGTVRLNEKALDLPLRWRKPKRIFVNSMSDLFHKSLSDETIDRVFGVMAAASRHTFLVLTKRPERMLAYVGGLGTKLGYERIERACRVLGWTLKYEGIPLVSWPLPNVWLGVSCENQATADERIPLLLQTPAAKRFVSAEPLLGPVDLGYTFSRAYIAAGGRAALDWIIAGGESGPGARPCGVAWIRAVVEQCKEAAVPVFVKQLGAQPFDDALDDHEPWPVSCAWSGDGVGTFRPRLRSRSGSDPTEWPDDLRVQEWPS